MAAIAASVVAHGVSLRLSEGFLAFILFLVPLGYWVLTGCLWATAYRAGQTPANAGRRWGTMVAAGIVAGGAWLPLTAAASLVGDDPYTALANGGWKLLPALMAREIVRLLHAPVGIYYLSITPILFVILLTARNLAPGRGNGTVSRTLAMAVGGLTSGLLTKPLLMLTAPYSIHWQHVLDTCTIFAAFACGLSLGELLAGKLDPPEHQTDSNDDRQSFSEASDSQGS